MSSLRIALKVHSELGKCWLWHGKPGSPESLHQEKPRLVTWWFMEPLLFRGQQQLETMWERPPLYPSFSMTWDTTQLPVLLMYPAWVGVLVPPTRNKCRQCITDHQVIIMMLFYFYYTQGNNLLNMIYEHFVSNENNVFNVRIVIFK